MTITFIRGNLFVCALIAVNENFTVLKNPIFALFWSPESCDVNRHNDYAYNNKGGSRQLLQWACG